MAENFAMEKDISIINFITRLKTSINFNRVEIVDYWEADLCAIGLRDGDKLIYISTYNYLYDKEVKFDFDKELLNNDHLDEIKIVETGRNVSEEDLIHEIKLFLGV